MSRSTISEVAPAQEGRINIGDSRGGALLSALFGCRAPVIDHRATADLVGHPCAARGIKLGSGDCGEFSNTECRESVHRTDRCRWATDFTFQLL